jgi:hypothetical protein
VIELPVQQHVAVTQRSFGSQGVGEESV